MRTHIQEKHYRNAIQLVGDLCILEADKGIHEQSNMHQAVYDCFRLGPDVSVVATIEDTTSTPLYSIVSKDVRVTKGMTTAQFVQAVYAFQTITEVKAV